MAPWKDDGAREIVNCTLSGNSSELAGGGGYGLGSGTFALDVQNSVLWGNSAAGVFQEFTPGDRLALPVNQGAQQANLSRRQTHRVVSRLDREAIEVDGRLANLDLG